VDFNKNYFDIFGLPVDYAVDQELLADRFLELQKEVHPDRFVVRTDQEKRLAMQWSTLVNTANETLRASLPRAVYLLGLRGIELEHNPTLPPAFLMEQIDLREQLESI
jgi:molecular chaperone HscB